MKDQEFSREGTRMVSAEPFGIACYQRIDLGEGRAHYHHVGIVPTDEEAARWLVGDPAVVPMPIFAAGDES